MTQDKVNGPPKGAVRPAVKPQAGYANHHSQPVAASTTTKKEANPKKVVTGSCDGGPSRLGAGRSMLRPYRRNGMGQPNIGLR